MVKPSQKRAGLDSSYRTYVHLAQGYLALPSVILCLRQCLLCIPYWPTSVPAHSATLRLLFALRVFHPRRRFNDGAGLSQPSGSLATATRPIPGVRLMVAGADPRLRCHLYVRAYRSLPDSLGGICKMPITWFSLRTHHHISGPGLIPACHDLPSPLRTSETYR